MNAWGLFKIINRVANITNRPDMFEIEFFHEGKSYPINSNVQIINTEDYPQKFKLVFNCPSTNFLKDFELSDFDNCLNNSTHVNSYRFVEK